MGRQEILVAQPVLSFFGSKIQRARDRALWVIHDSTRRCAMAECPYCKSSNFDDPKPVAEFVPEEIRHLVPHVVQCQDCEATFSVKVLKNPERHARQVAMVALAAA